MTVKINGVVLVHETPLAFLIGWSEGDPVQGEEIWIPKSQVVSTNLSEKGDEGYIEIPKWLAETKNLDP